MVELLYLLFSIVAPLFVLLGPKGLLTCRVISGVDNKKLPVYDVINCFVPFYNSYRIMKALNGKATFLKIFNFVAVLTMIGAIVVRFLVPTFVMAESTHQFIQVITTFWLILFLLVSYGIELYIHIDLFRMFNKKKLMILSLIPPVASALLAANVLPYFRQYRTRLDGTFSGNGSK